MAWKPRRPCTHPGCTALTETGRCDKHIREQRKSVDVARGTARERGYTALWDRLSKAFIKGKLCAICKRAPATCTDHIIPHKGNTRLFWDVSNWQPACKACNDRKAVGEGRWG